MKSSIPNLITVGLSPCWDITCEGENLRWGEHQKLSRQTLVPAGKALNVSRALSEMGVPSLAAGFWGQADLETMQNTVAKQMPRVLCRFTAVAGQTRQNITLIDRKRGKEMHLRAPSELATPRSYEQLEHDLGRILRKGMICIFAGAMPKDDCAKPVQRLIAYCRGKNVKLVIDSSGPIFRQAVLRGSPWLIKPNVEELRELLGTNVPDRTRALIEAATSLLNCTEMILLSRGAKGALLITREGVWSCQHRTPLKNIQHTVGGGDYLLAGFLAGWTRGAEYAAALQYGMQMATRRILGGEVQTFLSRLSDVPLKTESWKL